MSTDTFNRFITPSLFERIVQSPHHLIAFETTEVADAVNQFRQLVLRGGQAVYLWQNEFGIVSLRESEVCVASCSRVSEALRYILQSLQFGVYLFTNFAEHLRPMNIGLLRQIARLHTGNPRKVVLLGPAVALPKELNELVERIVHNPSSLTRPRLRDGRWVM